MRCSGSGSPSGRSAALTSTSCVSWLAATAGMPWVPRACYDEAAKAGGRVLRPSPAPRCAGPRWDCRYPCDSMAGSISSSHARRAFAERLAERPCCSMAPWARCSISRGTPQRRSIDELVLTRPDMVGGHPPRLYRRGRRHHRDEHVQRQPLPPEPARSGRPDAHRSTAARHSWRARHAMSPARTCWSQVPSARSAHPCTALVTSRMMLPQLPWPSRSRVCSRVASTSSRSRPRATSPTCWRRRGCAWPLGPAHRGLDDLRRGPAPRPMAPTRRPLRRRSHEAGVDVLGVNCGYRPDRRHRCRSSAWLSSSSWRRLMIMPNAGLSSRIGGEFVWAAEPAYFGQDCAALPRGRGASLGGCCGTTPAHIGAMRQALDRELARAGRRRRQPVAPRAAATNEAAGTGGGARDFATADAPRATTRRPSRPSPPRRPGAGAHSRPLRHQRGDRPASLGAHRAHAEFGRS